jgi:hypothetical protein
MMLQYYLLVIYSYTCSPLADMNTLNFFFKYEYNDEGRPFWIPLVICLLTMLITSVQVSSWHLHEELKITPNADEYSLIQWIQTSTWCVECLLQWTYTEHNVASLMLTDISSQIFLRAVCLMSPSITQNKKIGT